MFSSYQTSVAVIKAKLSGYIPVSMLLNDGHIRVLDRATELVELQLQARGFLCESGRRGRVIQGLSS